MLIEIYQSKDFATMIKKVRPVNLQEDIKQHVFVQLFEKEELFITDLNGKNKLRPYIATMVWNISRLRASNSFTKQLGLKEIPTEGFRDVPYETEDLFYVPLNKIHWYKARIIELYAELGTYAEVAKFTGIPTCSVFRTVRQARKEIKKLI